MKKAIPIKKIKNVFCVILICCMLQALLCACSGSYTHEFSLSENIISGERDLSLSVMTGKNIKSGEIVSSGMTTLYIDKRTASPVLKNQYTMWSALPRKVNSSSNEIPSVLSLEIMVKGQRYLLNSQTDAVKNSAPAMTKVENGVRVDYIFSANCGDEQVQITVPVTFALEDGSFFVSVNTDEIDISDKNVVITSLHLMEYFGSDIGADEGDYILVPDNCGAVIYTAKAKKYFKNPSFKIYGDYEKNNALAGIFGMKKKSSAFVVMIEEGDAVASINTGTAVYNGYNRVGAQFEITETSPCENGESRVVVSEKSYSGEIRLCYRFVEGNSADYPGMAIACREHLIREGVLPADTVKNTANLPFVLSTVGEATDSLGKQVALTSYEQLLDMLTYLKGKGFPNVFIRYRGALTGGLGQTPIEKCEKLKSLGTEDDFKELSDYISAQQMKLFFDFGFTSSASAATKASEQARNISGSLYSVNKTNLLGGTYKAGLAAYDRIDDNVISIFSLVRKSGISDICVNDASAFIYSDIESGATRDDVKKMIKSESASLSTIGDVMVEKGNLYMLKNASFVASLPLAASYKESSFYKSVPFIPLVLHATVEYSGEPINLNEDYHKAMLKCVEYGASLQFEWCYEDIAADNNEEISENSEQAEGVMRTYSYSDWATEAYAFYDKANRALADIRDLRMTDHYRVGREIYCTEYGESSIYVNYSDKDVKIGGVTVPAKDFMRVN